MHSWRVDPKIDVLAAWSAATAGWLASLDDPELPELVDQALQQIIPFDLSVVFVYPAGEGPRLLFDGLRRSAPAAAMSAYLNGSYLLDPFYLACKSNPLCGLYRMSDFAPDAYFESEYFNSWQVHPCISMDSGSLAEEIAYLFRLPDGSMAAYSLMRSNGRPTFGDEELAVLRAVEPQVRQALRHHWRTQDNGPPEASPAKAFEPSAGHALEEAFATFAARRLTKQQQRIVQLILRGHSNASIGHHLTITEGTVKNHRHQIYERLAVGTQAELFSLFVQHLAI